MARDRKKDYDEGAMVKNKRGPLAARSIELRILCLIMEAVPLCVCLDAVALLVGKD